MSARDLPQSVLERRAIVYVRQSTGIQVKENLESQRRQYELADLAREYGFRDVRVIDDDLGRSASGTTDRPGFRSLVGQICEGVVGAVFCLEASRLARNGRDWHHLLELCGLVGARVIDAEGAHDPSTPNDRLLPGLKGTMSEFELTVLRRRLLDAAVAKARRGELRTPVPVGYLWSRDTGLALDPDRRVQESVRAIFRLFDRFGTARQVLLHMHREGLMFPRPADAKKTAAYTWTWRSPAYRNVISVLQKPFYAGAYAYGKSGVKTTIVDGHPRKAYGRARPMASWTVLLRDHHEGYITWDTFERTQQRLACNLFSKRAGGSRDRATRVALAMRCTAFRRASRSARRVPISPSLPRSSLSSNPTPWKLRSWPSGTSPSRWMRGAARSISSANRPSTKPSSQRVATSRSIRITGSSLRSSKRDGTPPSPSCASVRRVLPARRDDARPQRRIATHSSRWPNDLESVWNTPTTTNRTKQRLIRALIEEIVVDVDDANREVVLVIHWRGGRHSELRVRKPATGEHTKRAPEQADHVIREMGARWSDADIATTLNRMGLSTGQGMTWNAARVGAYRRTHDIPGYESAVKDGRCLTMLEAAQKLDVSCHAIRKLIRDGVLPARQLVFDAPWQILAADLDRPDVLQTLRDRRKRRGRPCRFFRNDRNLVLPGT